MGVIVTIVAAWAVIAVGIAVAAALYPGAQGQPVTFNGLIDWRL